WDRAFFIAPPSSPAFYSLNKFDKNNIIAQAHHDLRHRTPIHSSSAANPFDYRQFIDIHINHNYSD
ncbi:hypothetical protein, partial [Aeromonas sobria]|uniref:hypothetical protein n=3 Tax=Aeromonas sobria TaxID=646 RepID=UPI001CBA65F6